MRAINVLLSILVSLAIGLGVFEGGLRLIGLGPPNTLNQFDPDSGWSKKLNHKVTRVGQEFGEVVLETNAVGLRDDPMADFSKPADTFRVVMLGDSFTLGYTVNREDLFVDLLEQRWNAEGRKVEVLNVGTEGWSTDQEVAWLMAHGVELQPDLVVLLPYDNDVFYCGQASYGGFPKPRFTPAGELEFSGLVAPSLGWKKSTALGRLISSTPSPSTFKAGASKSIAGDFSILMNTAPKILGDAPARAKGALIALKSECAKLGAELVIAPIPSNSSVDPSFASKFGSKVFGLPDNQWSADRSVEFFLASAKELGITATDARSRLKSAHAKEACYDDFFGKDREWHLNPEGNRVFANFLSGELDSMVPAATAEAPANFSMKASAAPDSGGLPTWLKVFLVLWVLLTALYFGNYKDENFLLPPLKVGALLLVVISTFRLVAWGAAELAIWNPTVAKAFVPVLIVGILGFVAYKMGNRLATICELIKAFVLRGHWYLMPLVVVLLTIGSLLVVAASSPLVAPFIYTLF